MILPWIISILSEATAAAAAAAAAVGVVLMDIILFSQSVEQERAMLDVSKGNLKTVLI